MHDRMSETSVTNDSVESFAFYLSFIMVGVHGSKKVDFRLLLCMFKS